MKISYKKGSIFYEVSGKGAPVVLLHGFLEDTTMWGDLVSSLVENHRIITIDLLGHGETIFFEEVHTMEMMAEAVHSVLDHLGVAKASFVGHSMGGYVALAFAELFPEKIAKLCLLTSTPEADSPERKANRERAIEAVKHNTANFVHISIENLFSPSNRDRFRDKIATVKQQAIKTSRKGIIAALKGMKSRKDRTQVLNGFQGEKLIIAGKQDPFIDWQQLQKIAESTQTRFQVLEGGHMLHIENQADHNIFIENFIDN